MRRLQVLVGSSAFLLLPFLTFAQLADDPALGGTNGTGGGFSDLLKNILTFTNDLLIPFVIGIGFLVFVWGMFQFFIAGGSNDESKEKGKSLMIYATLGFVLIIVFWGVINLLSTSTGLDNKDIGSVPKVIVPVAPVVP
jgi:Type IV secretion system pilin